MCWFWVRFYDHFWAFFEWALNFGGVRPTKHWVIVLYWFFFLAGNRFFSRHCERERRLFTSWIGDTEFRFGFAPSDSEEEEEEKYGRVWWLLRGWESRSGGDHFPRLPQEVCLSYPEIFFFNSDNDDDGGSYELSRLFLCMEWNGSWINESALDLAIRLSPITRRRSKQWKPANPPPCSSTSITSCSSTISSKRPFLKNTWGFFFSIFDSFLHSKT